MFMQWLAVSLIVFAGIGTLVIIWDIDLDTKPARIGMSFLVVIACIVGILSLILG